MMDPEMLRVAQGAMSLVASRRHQCHFASFAGDEVVKAIVQDIDSFVDATSLEGLTVAFWVGISIGRCLGGDPETPLPPVPYSKGGVV